MKFISITTVVVFTAVNLLFRTSIPNIHVETKMNAQSDLKKEAFRVLQVKCNTCHATKKRTEVFTLENMDSLGSLIYQQVLIKKKMPKGKKVTLTKEETEVLRLWLSSVEKVSFN